MRVLNISRVPKKFVDVRTFKNYMKTIHLGPAAGSRGLYVNIDHIKPGAKSVKYHSHSKQEEFFLILAGRGILRLNGKRRVVKKGDFFAKPAGKGIAHQFINTGSKILQILDCGLVEPHDVITYPDENVVLNKRTGCVLKNRKVLRNWSSDPNS